MNPESKPTVRERNPLTTSRARAFHLVRDDDETGISGTGVVAEGVEFSNGFCAMSWLTSQHRVAVYPNVKALEAIHGHNGRTRVVWEPDRTPVPMAPSPQPTDAIEAAISLEYDDYEYARAQEQFRVLTGRPHRYTRRVAQAHPTIKPAGERVNQAPTLEECKAEFVRVTKRGPCLGSVDFHGIAAVRDLCLAKTGGAA